MCVLVSGRRLSKIFLLSGRSDHMCVAFWGIPAFDVDGMLFKAWKALFASIYVLCRPFTKCRLLLVFVAGFREDGFLDCWPGPFPRVLVGWLFGVVGMYVHVGSGFYCSRGTHGPRRLCFSCRVCCLVACFGFFRSCQPRDLSVGTSDSCLLSVCRASRGPSRGREARNGACCARRINVTQGPAKRVAGGWRKTIGPPGRQIERALRVLARHAYPEVERLEYHDSRASGQGGDGEGREKGGPQAHAIKGDRLNLYVHEDTVHSTLPTPSVQPRQYRRKIK